VTARRTRVRRRVAVLVGVIGCAACRIQEVPRTGRIDPAEVAREEIDAARNVYREGLLNGDAAAIADVFTYDATLAEPDAPDVVGSAAIELAMRRSLTNAVVTDVLLEPDPIDIGEGGVAFEFGRFEQTLQSGDKRPVTRRGRYAIRWLRGPDDDWRIEHMLYNLYPSEPAADTSATR
jgi:ketosteroid isomerase-like protein